MKFFALVAAASAIKSPRLGKMNYAQIKSALGQEEYTVEEVFHWFDRDGSGAVDIYEFIFGLGWICGYHEYEPTDEDVMMMTEFWYECDTDMNGELSLEEVQTYAHNNGF